MFISRFTLLAMLWVISPLWAADIQLKPGSGEVPEDVSAEMAGLLTGPNFKVVKDGKELAEFWLRGQVNLKPEASGGLGVHFGRMEPGTFVGVVSIPETWHDYRNFRINDGVFTLRYSIQPADGNHMGVSLYRDFLLLIPSEIDEDPEAELNYDELVKLSNRAARRSHPATLSLFPVPAAGAEPSLVENELGQSTVAIKVGELSLGLVIVGHGEVEGG